MAATINMSFVDALELIKRSLEMGKVQNAMSLLDSLISQLKKHDAKTAEAEVPAGSSVPPG